MSGLGKPVRVRNFYSSFTRRRDATGPAVSFPPFCGAQKWNLGHEGQEGICLPRSGRHSLSSAKPKLAGQLSLQRVSGPIRELAGEDFHWPAIYFLGLVNETLQ